MRTATVPLICWTLLAASGCAAQAHKVSATSTGDLSTPAPAAGGLDEAFERNCGDGALTTAGESSLDRLPYLQESSSSAASVLFTVIDADSMPFVELTTPEGDVVARAEAQVDSSSGDPRQRVLRFEDLAPDTYYCYSLEGLTRRTGLRTAPALQRDESVRFVVFGDSGDGSGAQELLRDQMRQLPFDLMLHTGDVAYGSGSLSSLEGKFFDIYSDILRSVPVFPVAGNHDYGTGNGSPFRRVFALPENGGKVALERWFSFDWGPVHFVGLDTQFMRPEQTQWLEADLEANELPWTVAYLHKPPYSSGEHGSSHGVRDTFSPLFERYGVQVVFAGHDHDYERTEPIDGVTYVVTGGGGRGTRPVGSSSYTAFSEDVLHFVYGELAGDELRLHAIDATGQRFDSVAIPLEGG